jgi:hypothetical protein
MNTRFDNMNQFINLVNGSKNPQQCVLNMLEEKASHNPMYKNLVGFVQAGDTQSIETFVRNVAKEKGIDFDKEFNSFKQMFRL